MLECKRTNERTDKEWGKQATSAPRSGLSKHVSVGEQAWESGGQASFLKEPGGWLVLQGVTHSKDAPRSVHFGAWLPTQAVIQESEHFWVQVPEVH